MEPRSFTFPGAARALGSHSAVRDGRPGVGGDLHPPSPRSSSETTPIQAHPPGPLTGGPPPPLPPAPKTEWQRNGLLACIAPLMLFQGFEREDLTAMVEAMGARTVAPGEVVVRQGDDVRCFYVIEQGKFLFEVDGAPVGQLRDMGHFAELALLYDCVSEHTIMCQPGGAPGLLWVLDRAVYRAILHRRELEHRLRIAALIETTPTLRQVSSDRLVAIAKAFTSIRVEESCIVDRWSAAPEFFLVEEGAVLVRVRPMGSPGSSGGGSLPGLPHEVEHSVLGQGSYFGALAPLPAPPCEASVHALGSVKCAVLRMAALEAVLSGGSGAVGATPLDGELAHLTL